MEKRALQCCEPPLRYDMDKRFQKKPHHCHSNRFQDPKFLAFTPWKESCYFILFLTNYSMKHVPI